MNTTPQSRFLRALTTRITIFSYSAASDWAYDGMALNNVMPLYPQTQPPGPHSHPSGKHKEGECWIDPWHWCWLQTSNGLINLIVPHGQELSTSAKTLLCAQEVRLSSNVQEGSCYPWGRNAARKSRKLQPARWSVQNPEAGRLWAWNNFTSCETLCVCAKPFAVADT